MENLDQMIHCYRHGKLTDKDKLIETLISFYENIKKEVIDRTGEEDG